MYVIFCFIIYCALLFYSPDNADGSQWYPKPADLICSKHFIGGKKSETDLSPSYAPTIFCSEYKFDSVQARSKSKIARYKIT